MGSESSGFRTITNGLLLALELVRGCVEVLGETGEHRLVVLARHIVGEPPAASCFLAEFGCILGHTGRTMAEVALIPAFEGD